MDSLVAVVDTVAMRDLQCTTTVVVPYGTTIV